MSFDFEFSLFEVPEFASEHAIAINRIAGTLNFFTSFFMGNYIVFFNNIYEEWFQLVFGIRKK